MKKELTLFLTVILFFTNYSGWANCIGPCFKQDCRPIPYVHGECIYWKVHQDGLTYATSGIDTTREGKLYDLDFGFSPGFKIGAGILTKPRIWDLSLLYTWYRSHARDSLTADIETFGTWTQNGFSLRAADANWRLRFQTLDFVLKRNFFFFPRLIFSPSFGVKAAYTKETYQIDYTIDFPSVLEKVHNFQDYWAVGPLAGMKATFFFHPSFSLFAETRFSLLWGQFRVKRIGEGPTTTFQANIHHHFDSLNLVPEYVLGIKWDCLCSRTCRLAVLLAWEMQQWQKHNQMISGPIAYVPAGAPTDLNLYGASLSIRTFF